MYTDMDIDVIQYNVHPKTLKTRDISSHPPRLFQLLFDGYCNIDRIFSGYYTAFR